MLAMLAVACDSTDQDPLDEIRTMQAEGRIEESVAKLQELVEAGDRRGEVLYRYGRGLTSLSHVGRAVWSLDAVMSDPEWTVRAAHQLATNANRSGNHELALQTLARLREERTDGAGDDDLTALSLEARAYIGTRKNYDEALEPIEAILEIDRANEEALRLKAVALLGLKRTDEAYEFIREAGRVMAEANPDVESPQSGAYWCSIECSFQRESGEIAKAEEIVEECLERFPTSMPLIDEALKVYSTQGKRKEAVAVFQKAYESEPDDREIRFPYILQLHAMGRDEEAEAVLRSNLKRQTEKDEPNMVPLATAWVDLAGFLVDLGRLDEGLDAYAEARALLGDSVGPELLFSQAEAMILAERFEDALEIAEQTPVEVHGPMLRGRVAFERGDLDSALEELNEAALIWPDNAPVRYYLARAAEGLGQFDRAIEEYRQALRSDQDLDAARVRLSRLHLAEGRALHAKAIMRFVPTSENSQSSLDMRLVGIEIQARTGRTVDLDAIPSDPKRTPEASYALAVGALADGVLVRNGPEEAAETLARLQEELGGLVAPFLFRERIEALIAADKNEEAVKLARAAVADRSFGVHARITLGSALAQEESGLEEARDLLSAAVSERPEDADVLALLGEVESQLGETTNAIENFEVALSISPDNSDAMIGLARDLVRLGRRAEAVTRLESFLAQDNPIDGRVALEAAKLIEDGEGAKERRIALGFRALRFGAGQPAVDYLRQIDPALVPVEATEPAAS